MLQVPSRIAHRESRCTVTDEYLRRESSRADWAEDVVYKMSMHICTGAGSRPGALTTESCMI